MPVASTVPDAGGPLVVRDAGAVEAIARDSTRRPHDAPAESAAGPCVNASADALARVKRATDGKLGVDPSLLPSAPWTPDARPDLDGDGSPDAAFGWGAGGYNESILLYVIQRGCARFVDAVDVQGIDPLPTLTHGLRDLRYTDSAGCEGARCGCEPGSGILRFDGHRYVVDPATVRPLKTGICPDKP